MKIESVNNNEKSDMGVALHKVVTFISRMLLCKQLLHKLHVNYRKFIRRQGIVKMFI